MTLTISRGFLIAALAAFGVGAGLGVLAGRRRRAVEGALDAEVHPTLTRSLLGLLREDLTRRFGPPVIASAGDFRTAETWYYPVDAVRQTGLAITFAGDVVRRAELIRAGAA